MAGLTVKSAQPVLYLARMIGSASTGGRPGLPCSRHEAGAWAGYGQRPRSVGLSVSSVGMGFNRSLRGVSSDSMKGFAGRCPNRGAARSRKDWIHGTGRNNREVWTSGWRCGWCLITFPGGRLQMGRPGVQLPSSRRFPGLTFGLVRDKVWSRFVVARATRLPSIREAESS